MISYLKKCLYFNIPVFTGLLFIVIIDPYEFINISHVISPDLKIEVLNRSDEVSPRGNMLWKTIHFKRNPLSKLIIGDSQGNRTKEELIKEVSGEDYFNFCVEGASFETMIDVFWFATKYANLEEVFFQVGFMNYNASRSYNLSHFGKDYFDNPFTYFSTPDIFRDSYANLRYAITRDRDIVEQSYVFMGIDDLHGLSEKRLKLFFDNYKYPENIYRELKKISDYCIDNDIELNFLILPVYIKTIEYLEENDMMAENNRFKEDMKSLGRIYDFEEYKGITEVREYFIDYFHPKESILDKITREVWGTESN